MPNRRKETHDKAGKIRYEKYLCLREKGKILSPVALKMICEANGYDPERIGLHFLEVLASFTEEDLNLSI